MDRIASILESYPMSSKKICLVPAAFEVTDLPNLNCDDRPSSHTHISNSELVQGRCERKIEDGWLREPERYRNGVVRRIKKLPMRGLSCCVGESLAIAVSQGELIARAMLNEIRHQPERGRE